MMAESNPGSSTSSAVPLLAPSIAPDVSQWPNVKYGGDAMLQVLKSLTPDECKHGKIFFTSYKTVYDELVTFQVGQVKKFILAQNMGCVRQIDHVIRPAEQDKE
jgi:hypothetical protein